MPQIERFYDPQKRQHFNLEITQIEIIGRGNSCTYKVDLETEVTLEKDEKIIPGSLVSRNHLTISHEHDGVFIWDNGSSRGTFLKRYIQDKYTEKEQVFTRTRINRGDIIILGPLYEIKYLTKKQRQIEDEREKTLRTGETWVGE
jgi:pSer/pThr/pTyr-binding forkhead associated (FHA) protein